MKRTFDITVSLLLLILTSPLLLVTLFLVWSQDKKSPFYIAQRVGLKGQLFDMVKIRSMVIEADKSGVSSTSAKDSRITPVGQFIRKFKLDEIPQLWNILRGDMSFVGPRPNVYSGGVELYTRDEEKLLDVRPGLTDLASIVFSDEGDILKDSDDPDLDYNQLIRPWKSRLGLFYIENSSLRLDIYLVVLTAVNIISRTMVLERITALLAKLGAEKELIRIAKRNELLTPMSPPGTDCIVTLSENRT